MNGNERVKREESKSERKTHEQRERANDMQSLVEMKLIKIAFDMAVSIGFSFDVLFVIDKHNRTADTTNQFSPLNHKIYFQHLAFCRCQISRSLLHANNTLSTLWLDLGEKQQH